MTKFNFQIAQKDLPAFIYALKSKNVELLKAEALDEDDKTALTPFRMTVQTERPQILFWLGAEFESRKRLLTAEEEEELQNKYEFDNDL